MAAQWRKETAEGEGAVSPLGRQGSLSLELGNRGVRSKWFSLLHRAPGGWGCFFLDLIF